MNTSAKNGHYVLPHDLSAEASILGGVLLRNEVLARCGDLAVDDFYDHKHKVVFGAIRNLESSGTPIDIVLLESEIAKTGKLDAIGGVAFLGELTLLVPTPDNVEAYSDIVRLHAVNRRAMVELGDVLDQVGRGVHDPTEALVETIGTLQRLVETIGTKRAQIEIRTLAQLAPDIVAQSTVPEMDWGIDGLNAKAPIQIRSMGTIVGPTGSGKTALAITLGAHRCRYGKVPGKGQGPCVYFLFELTPAQLAARRTAQLSRFTWRQVLGGVMRQDEIEATLLGEHFYVVKPPRRVDLISYATRVLDHIAEIDPGEPLLVLDYLQRIKSSDRGGRELREQTSDVVDSIVDLVESRDMYGLLLSKGSRVGSRAMRDGKTKGEALVDAAAETSAIEAGSAAVLAITYTDRDGGDIMDARVEIAKGRFGATGSSVGMRFHGPSGRWTELEHVPMSPGERAADERVLAALDAAPPDGYASRNALCLVAKGNRRENLEAMKRLFVPGGPLEERGGRLYRRSR